MEVIEPAAVANAVIALVDGATKGLILVTPYFKPWLRLTQAIKGARARGVTVMLLLRGGHGRPEREAAASEFLAVGVKAVYLTRLHAKIYVSESTAILTSLNLYEDSALDSWEVAVRMTKAADAEGFAKVKAVIEELCRKTDEEADVAKLERAHAAADLFKGVGGAMPVRPVRRTTSPGGHCIRCGNDLAFNPERPLCGTCYNRWAKFKDGEYTEAYCHRCGKERATSHDEPMCGKCRVTRA